MELLHEKSTRTNNVACLGAYLKCKKGNGVEWKCRAYRCVTLLLNGTDSIQISKASFHYLILILFLDGRIL